MKTPLKTLMLSLMAASLLNAFADERELSYAVEDAAYQAVSRLSADGRLKGVKTIAFVKLMLPEGEKELKLGRNITHVFESSLSSVPTDLRFVLHGSRDAEWTLIDEIFDQATDFASYNPATHPKFKQLKLADALLFGRVIDAEETKDGAKTSVRISLRLLRSRRPSNCGAASSKASMPTRVRTTRYCRSSRARRSRTRRRTPSRSCRRT